MCSGYKWMQLDMPTISLEDMCAVVIPWIPNLFQQQILCGKDNMQAMFETINVISTTSHHTEINECALGISGCNQYCTNTNRSYVCSCYLGYQISSNNRTCVGKIYH